MGLLEKDESIARARELVARETADLADLSHGYPANHFAWRVVMDSARRSGAASLVEVGVGSGNGVAHVLAGGLRYAGVDRDADCVSATRGILADLGGDPADVIVADAQDAAALAALPGAGDFDALMALGVMPHARDREGAIRGMAGLVRPGGEMFVEFRNSLFSLVTFNRFTRDFIVDDLLADAAESTRDQVAGFLASRVDADRPPLPSSGHEARYDNPFVIRDWLGGMGFDDVSIHPFHFHAGMPMLEVDDPQGFRDGSLALEDDESGWRGMFLCSVFLARIVIP